MKPHVFNIDDWRGAINKEDEYNFALYIGIPTGDLNIVTPGGIISKNLQAFIDAQINAQLDGSAE